MTQLRVTLERSGIGHPEDQKSTVRALGLRHLHQSVIVADNPSIRGMLHKVRHLITVQSLEESGE